MANTQQYEEFEEDLAGALASRATDKLRVTRVGEADTNIKSWGGTAQSGVDVSGKIDEIEDALASVGTDRWRNELYAEDAAATGSIANVHRRGDALQISIENDQADLLTSTDQPLDVSGATVTVDDGGAFAVASGPLDGALASNGTDELRVDVTPTEPLDVSAATVTTDLSNDISRSVGTVRQEQPGSLIAFQHTTSSTNAETLAANAVSPNGTITVQADPDNAGDVFLGNGTNQPIQLSPGDSIGNINVDDTSDLSVNANNSGDAVNVVAS